jgi:hypothetical protein
VTLVTNQMNNHANTAAGLASRPFNSSHICRPPRTGEWLSFDSWNARTNGLRRWVQPEIDAFTQDFRPASLRVSRAPHRFGALFICTLITPIV